MRGAKRAFVVVMERPVVATRLVGAVGVADRKGAGRGRRARRRGGKLDHEPENGEPRDQEASHRLRHPMSDAGRSGRLVRRDAIGEGFAG